MSYNQALDLARRQHGGKVQLIRKTFKMWFSGNRYSMCYLIVDGVIRGVGKDWKDTLS